MELARKAKRKAKTQTPEFIGGDAPTIIQWLSEEREPDLWHEIARDFNYDSPVTTAVLDWIVDQPECDAATAALIFLQLGGEFYCARPCDDADLHEGSPQMILHKIAERSENGGYAQNALNLACAGHPNDQSALIERIEGARAQSETSDPSAYLPLPTTLFAEPLNGRDAVSGHHIEESVIFPARDG